MESAQVFRPKPGSQQGTRNAWILAGFASIIELVLLWRTGTLPGWLSLLTVFLLLAALLMSLSNWVDQKTILVLEPEGITFRNGLRNVRLGWAQINRVSVIPDRWGLRVVVVGTAASFSFRMLSAVELRGKAAGQMGFPEGEAILQEIIQASQLSLAEKDKTGQYYARPV